MYSTTILGRVLFKGTMMVEYKINAKNIDYDRKRKCMQCGSGNLELIQLNQLACKDCRTLWFATDISDEEMIEWFID